MNKVRLVFVIAASVGLGFVVGSSMMNRPAQAQSPHYIVYDATTNPWIDQPGKFEAHLNSLGSQGYRLHSSIGRYLIFERK